MAITLVEGTQGTSAGPPGSIAFTISVPIGDPIFAFVSLGGNPNFPGAAIASACTVSDNINTGNYANIGFYYNSTNDSWGSVYWKIANATGTPTISCTLVNNTFGIINGAHFNGFAGTPTIDTSMNLQVAGNSATVIASPIVTNFNGELLLFSDYVAAGATMSSFPNWNIVKVGETRALYAVIPNSGTTNNLSGPLTASNAWTGIALGVYDLSATTLLGQACL